jgi:itaconate CoA-transferase
MPGSQPPPATEGPLSEVTVIALEHSVAGPLCTRILAEMGADVLKLERAPTGDFARHWDHNARGESAQFWWLNRGKRSESLDLRTEHGQARLQALVEQADVLVYNMSPAAARRAGLTRDELASRNPRLVACQISGYGAQGSWADRKAYDMLVQAEAGLMSVTGRLGEPTRTGVSVCDVLTGVYAATLVLGALRERDLTGTGRHLEVAMLDCALELVAPMLTSYINAGVLYTPRPQHHHALAPYGCFRCADGAAIVLAVEQDDEWQRFCELVLHDPELATDERFAHNVERLQHVEQLVDLIERHLTVLDIGEVVRRLEVAAIAYAIPNDMAAVAAHPVVAERGGLVASGVVGDEDSVISIEGLAARAFGRSLAGLQPPPLSTSGAEEVLSR